MFGVVPRVVWEKRDPPDEQNRVTLGAQRRADRDRGQAHPGGHRNGRQVDARRRSACTGSTARPRSWAACVPTAWGRRTSTSWSTPTCTSTTPAATRASRAAECVPTFPRARYVVQLGEWEDATHPHERNRASYREDDFVPVAEARQLDTRPGRGRGRARRARRPASGGHTAYHQMVVVEGGGETLVVPTDLLPTASHLPLPFVMGYDLFPVGTLEAKRRLLEAAVDDGWRILFYHDPRTPLGRVRRDGDGYILRGRLERRRGGDRHHRRQRPLRDGRASTGARELAVETPFGPPSDRLVLGHARGPAVAFLPRHGRGHRILPSELQLPGQRLRPEDAGRRAHPLRVRGRLAQGEVRAAAHGDPRPVRGPHLPAAPRPSSARGLVAHVAFAHPFCADLRGGAGRGLRARRAPPCTRAAPTSASRARSSRRARSPSCTARGAWTSSG